MKRINHLLTLLAALLLLGACEKDGDKFFLSTPESNELVASTEAIVLKEENANLYALSLAWTAQTLQISDARYEPTTGVETTVQAALTEDFSGTMVESVESGLSKSYTVSALNTLAYQLGATETEATPVYFRLAGRNGSNTEAVYSNTVNVTVTPYQVDMRYADLVPGGDNPIASTVEVYSANADGDYYGFLGAGSWGSFFLREANGSLWHTVNSNNIGSPFLLTTDGEEGTWGQWLPGQAGCYYLHLNTVQRQWTALLMPTLEVSGIDGLTMTYSQRDNQWKGVFSATEAGNVDIQIQGTGQLYDNTSISGSNNGIDDSKAKATSFVFGGNANQLTFSTGENVSAGAITVNVPATGECTLVIDLNNPTQWTATVTEGGSTEPEPEIAQYLYLPGIGPEEAWTYDRKIALYDESKLLYAGGVNVESRWGNYAMCTTDYWDANTIYTLSEGDAAQGTLVQGGSNNITAPANGLYLFEVSLSELTYRTTAIESVSCYLGIEGDNSLITLNATETVGIYSGTVTLTKDSDWGLKFVINNWAGSYGGYEGALYYNANDGIKPLAAGTYQVSVDLINHTYTINQ